MNNKRNTVIFDLDGTLLNTLEDLTNSVNYVMQLHHFPLHTMETVRQMVGNGIRVLMERALPNGHLNPHFDTCLAEFQAYYKMHMQEKTAPFDGLLPLLETLQKQGYQLAVVSNKFDAAVKSLCEDYFGSLIPIAIGESDKIARKPAPDTVFEAMHLLHVTPDNCIYVGDSEVDIETAKNAGIPCICVSWGFRSKAFLQEHSATFIAENSNELLNAICHFRY